MSDISSATKLAFFKAEKYEYERYNVFDASNCPRPHFCMGLILEGRGEFRDCTETETVVVEPGDIIFVPITSCYISTWSGEPRISYVSMHFIFDYPGMFSRQRNFKLQKISAADVPNAREAFEYMLCHYNGNEAEQLVSLSKFYEILGGILPRLKTKQTKDVDLRINIAVEYIEQNYDQDISIDTLAKLCSISVSRFFPCFKSAMGVTPVEYLQHYRVNRAIILLMNNDETSIESVSETVGFASSAYFRRVFKKVTGKTPREYRKTPMEI